MEECILETQVMKWMVLNLSAINIFALNQRWYKQDRPCGGR